MAFHGEYDAASHGLASELGTAISADDVLRLVDSPKNTVVAIALRID